MLGLGASISKNKKLKKPIVKDNLVLRHDYMRGGVNQVSTGAAFFNGSSDYIQLPSAFSNASNKITVSAWVYNTGSGTEAIFENRNDGITDPSERGILFYVDSNQALRAKCQNVTTSGTNGLFLNKWVHACFTYDSRAGGTDELKSYENGVLAGTGNVSHDFDDTAWSNARIGRGNVTDYYFPGYICNVGIWDEVLTQPQIKSIMWKNYADLTSSEKTDLVSWYNLDSTLVTGNASHPRVYDNHHGGADELGSEMWDGANGSHANWQTWASNELTASDGAVRITYKGGGAANSTSGAYIYLRNAYDMNADLVVGKTYKITFNTKVNSSSVTWKINETSDPSYEMASAVTSTDWVEQSMYFNASHATGHYLWPLQASEIVDQKVWIKDISIKLVNGNTGTLV